MAFDFPASPSIDQDYVAGTVTYTYNGTGWVLKGTNAGQFVSKSGDTMTGNLTITKSGPQIILNKTAAGSPRGEILGQIAGSSRWALVMPSGGEDFAICRYDDTGTQIDVPFNIVRLTGQTNLTVTTASTSPTTGALTVAGGVGVNGAINTAGDLTLANGLAINWKENVSGTSRPVLSVYLNDSYIDNRFTGTLYFRGGPSAGSTTTLMSLDSAGNLKLSAATASTSPTTGTLQVVGGVGVGNNIYVSGAIFAGPNGIVTGNGGNSGIYYFGTATNNKIIQWDATKFNLIGGRLAIPDTTATTSPTTGALTVAGGLGVSGALFTGGDIWITRPGAAFYIQSTASDPAQYFYNAAGKQWRLIVPTSTNAFWITDADDGQGVALGQNQTSWGVASDRRLPWKQSRKPVPVLDRIKDFELWEFERKGTIEYGGIAQDMYRTFPGLVQRGTDDDDRELGKLDPGMWIATYDRAGVLALGGIKELLARLETLEARLAKEK